MTMKKNPGLGARMVSVEAALTARSDAPALSEPNATIVPLSLRLPRPTHETLRKMAFDRRVSIHSLILEGVEKVIAEKG